MQRQSGFTLIEVMITIAIIAILVGIALPSYTNYVTRGKIQEATTALLSTRVKMEQFFQDNRAYPASCVIAPVVPGATQVQVPALKYFSISCAFPNANQYVVRADGGVDPGGTVIDNALVGLRLEINEANQRWTRSAPVNWGSTVASTLPKQCWTIKTNGEC
jgi:type IV pilus assembly protein PilE